MWDGVGFRKAKVYMEVPGGTIGGYFGAGRPFRIFNTGQHGRVSDIESAVLCSAWMGVSRGMGNPVSGDGHCSVADAAQQYGECAAHSAAVWSAVAYQCDLAAAVFLTASLGVIVCLVAAGFRPGIGDVHPLFQEQPMGWRPYDALSGVVGLCGCTELFHSKAQPAVTRAHFQAIPVFQRDALAFEETIWPVK